ncbi:hypothetical protein FD754_021479 [Muntiacus muntjak]|uniref:Sushi domain-containing protein n=1 Tax=Muntiacus muntjak TaxID=9888 RepID=A0A5N3V5W9_MUNMU|nr:hypothetical protein FD754_021479 [Muntiacus muntjak]
MSLFATPWTVCSPPGSSVHGILQTRILEWIAISSSRVRHCDFPKINHGILYNEKKYKASFPVSPGKIFYYSCEYNFMSPSKLFWTPITCTEGGWSPTPKCLRVCFFPFVENGHSASSGQTHLEGDTVRITCNKGYSLPDNQGSITCAEAGWSSPPECVSTKKCLKTDIVVANGFLSESEYAYSVNKETQYKCKPGYTTADGKTSGTVQCLQGGWSSQPTCIKSCDRPALVNARVKSDVTWFQLNDRLDYECHAGYENQDGRSTGSIVCGEDGWSHLPICREIECHLPFLEANVDANPKQEKYKVGDVLKFSCRQRLKRVGPDSVQCYQFGWSPNFPTCKGQVRSCGQPPQLPNGKMKHKKQEKYEHNEMVEYDCNPNFVMKGPKKIQCMDGEWTTLPTCVEPGKACRFIPQLENGYSQPSVPPYRHGVSVVLSCRSAYTMIGNAAIACIDGIWTELPKCVATNQLKRCEKPRFYVRGQLSSYMYEFNHNARVSYKCAGKSTYIQTVCINGKWDPEPDCLGKKKQLCPPPPQIPNAQNMRTTVNYQEGEKVTVLCKENYAFLEAKELVCKSGQWQSLPQCVGQCISNSDQRRNRFETFTGNLILLIRITQYPALRCRAGILRVVKAGKEVGKEEQPDKKTGDKLGKVAKIIPGPNCNVGVLPLILQASVPQFDSVLTLWCPRSNASGIMVTLLLSDEANKLFAIRCLIWSLHICSFCDRVGRSVSTMELIPADLNMKLKHDGQRKRPLLLLGVKKVNAEEYLHDVCITLTVAPENKNGKGVTCFYLYSVIKCFYGERKHYSSILVIRLHDRNFIMSYLDSWTSYITSSPLSAYPPGAVVRYRCQSFYELRGNLTVTCRNGRWSEPPTCVDACIISEDRMNKNNIQLKWRTPPIRYAKTGDFIEFECKRSHREKTPVQSFRVLCQEGKFEYPTCE